MIALGGDLKILLCTQVTDMRRSFDGLSAQIRQELGDDPASGALFVFINRRRIQMKCLYFEAGGYCLWSTS
jgi:transposase